MPSLALSDKDLEYLAEGQQKKIKNFKCACYVCFDCIYVHPFIENFQLLVSAVFASFLCVLFLCGVREQCQLFLHPLGVLFGNKGL